MSPTLGNLFPFRPFREDITFRFEVVGTARPQLRNGIKCGITLIRLTKDPPPTYLPQLRSLTQVSTLNREGTKEGEGVG